MKLLNSFWFVDVGRLLYNGPTISHFFINSRIKRWIDWKKWKRLMGGPLKKVNGINQSTRRAAVNTKCWWSGGGCVDGMEGLRAKAAIFEWMLMNEKIELTAGGPPSPINFIKFKDKSFLLIHWLLKKWIKRYYNSMLKVISWYKIILNLLMNSVKSIKWRVDFMNEMTFNPPGQSTLFLS